MVTHLDAVTITVIIAYVQFDLSTLQRVFLEEFAKGPEWSVHELSCHNCWHAYLPFLIC